MFCWTFFFACTYSYKQDKYYDVLSVHIHMSAFVYLFKNWFDFLYVGNRVYSIATLKIK